ncbi:hypothetical protein EVC45_36165 [Paraburkholderia sp. UYCP14C]|uniref:hypothetical protein n=1 Tax=Paraburkholderia sp. UYCP14C TaxID=2511130 RepID=UPI00101EE8A9|nr:hypothetical protein [Paraburkholderia sp. UYCP14C]RZF24915.1 hypothetical protein EVC45_36165 [Paraburkholderia sp. UYCP14C]
MKIAGAPIFRSGRRKDGKEPRRNSQVGLAKYEVVEVLDACNSPRTEMKLAIVGKGVAALLWQFTPI